MVVPRCGVLLSAWFASKVEARLGAVLGLSQASPRAHDSSPGDALTPDVEWLLTPPPPRPFAPAPCSSSLATPHNQMEPGAVVCRVAPSFVRFGTFQLPVNRGGLQSGLTKLAADYGEKENGWCCSSSSSSPGCCGSHQERWLLVVRGPRWPQLPEPDTPDCIPRVLPLSVPPLLPCSDQAPLPRVCRA
jgi:hypothetical protein